MRAARVLLMLMRVAAGIQVVLGIGFWTGHWYGAVPVHMTVGSSYVVLLWILAVIALVQRRVVGVALFAILWGALVAALGYAQQGILAGSDFHWIVRVVHLLVSLSALGLAERLAARDDRPAATVASFPAP